ncbi:MAG: IS1595 family transposase [Rhodobacteraceae bacterium]|nr:IS1595 family transposase [Paracoccaceae bacterium]
MPGQSHRKGITLFDLQRMFPTDDGAKMWVANIRWGDKVKCPHCESDNIQTNVTHKTMDYRCRSCRKWFSVRTGTIMANSRLPIIHWVYAVYIQTSSLKGISSMKLYRELGITQRTAWFLSHRIRKAYQDSLGGLEIFVGPVEADETYMGGLEKNKHNKDKLKKGRGTVGKTAIVGVKDRETKKIKARVVIDTSKLTLQGFINSNVEEEAEKYTDESRSYQGLSHHSTVNHSAREFVDGMVHTNGIESFWSMLKRSHKGTFHKMSPKHLQRYVDEFVGRHNLRGCDTEEMMKTLFTQMRGKKLTYRDLITNNGLDNGARKL